MTITFEHKGKSWEIEYDGTSFVPRHIYQSENKDGEMTDRSRDIGYFTSLGSAIKKIVGNAMGESEETIPLAAFIERYESAVKELVGLFESEF